MRMWDFRIHADSRRGHHGCPQLAGKAACLVVALHPLRPERLLRRSLPTNSTIWRTYMMSPEKEFDAIDVDLAQLKQRIPLLEYLQLRDFVSRAWGTIKGAAVWERLGALPGSKSRGPGGGASNVHAALQHAQSTLLTKCLCGRDKRRTRAVRLHVCAPKATARPPLLGSRHAQKASIVAIFRAFRGPVNRVNSFP